MKTEPAPVVVDTNVLMQAFHSPNGVGGAALHFVQERYTLVQSPETLQELAEKLESRPFTAAHSTAQERGAFVDAIWNSAVGYERLAGVDACADPKDNMFLGLALASGAPLIVSSDKDLLTMNGFQGIRIVTPECS